MSDSPYELERLVTVATFSTPWEAQLAQARLGAEGLHSLIANEHVIRLVALSNAVGGIQLKVRERDLEAAAAVLRRLAPLPEIYLVTHDAADAALAEGGEAEEAGEPNEAGAAREEDGDTSIRPRPTSVEPFEVRPAPAGEAPPPAESARAVPAAHVALVTVARFHTPWEAHLARTFLESEGLRCCVLEERLPAVHLLSAEPVAYNRLEVQQDDAARATDILARAWSQPSLTAVPDPDPSDP